MGHFGIINKGKALICTMMGASFLLLGGCCQEDFYEEPHLPDIGFRIGCDGSWSEMKSAPVTTDEFYDSFGVSAYVYSGDWNESLTPEYMYDLEVLKSESWVTDKRWPGSGKNIRFFAYAPYGAEGLTISAADAEGTPVISYVVPDEASAQSDIVTSYTEQMSGASGGAVALDFAHVLTAISFVTGPDIRAGNISSIALKGVYGKGDHAIGSDAWDNHDNVRDFVQVVDVDAEENTSGISITEPAGTFMMIPQTLPDGACIEVMYTDEKTSTLRTLSASIGGNSWNVGESITYLISTSSLTIKPVLSADVPYVSYEGGEKTITVNSYYAVTHGGETQKVGIDWSFEFIEITDDGYVPAEAPDWVSVSEVTDNTIVIDVARQEGESERPKDAYLKSQTPVSGVYDLSTDGGASSMTTANCYLVNAPGSYSLPLVYGNAIRNGAANPSAYTYSGDQTSIYFLESLVNHTASAVTDPYIYNNAGCVPDNAVLIWQDAPSLLTDIRLDSEKKNLLFNVNQETICQGNAVVAVRDASNTVLWSWHIWVTDYVLGTGLQTLASASGTTRSLLPFNVGWCDKYKTYYPRRVAQFVLRQEELGTEQIILIVSNATTVTTYGHCTYYQFGRKDAFVPWSGYNSNNKMWYDSAGNSSTANFSVSPMAGEMNETTALWIQNPDVYCCSPGKGCKNGWNNLEIHNSTDETEAAKTIYDPSPKGFRVPLYSEMGMLDMSAGYGAYNSTERGWTYDLTPLGGDVITYYATKLRNNSTGVLETGGNRAYYLTSETNTANQALLNLSNDSALLSYYSLHYGGTIRPVAE